MIIATVIDYAQFKTIAIAIGLANCRIVYADNTADLNSPTFTAYMIFPAFSTIAVVLNEPAKPATWDADTVGVIKLQVAAVSAV